jgi:hypothetical protein
MSAFDKDLVLPTMNWTSDSELPNTLFGTGPDSLKLLAQSSAWSFDALELTFPLDYRISISQPTRTVAVTSPTVFVETIIHACKKYVNMHASEMNDNLKLLYDFAACSWSQEAHDMNNITQISEIAVRMLSAFAGLESYVYGVVRTLLVPMSCRAGLH